MHPTYLEFLLLRRHEELVRQAEHERLLSDAQQSRQAFYRAWAYWLGIKLVQWGKQLECFGTFNCATCTDSPAAH